MRIAVIPARGGSKRIPRKNVRLFAGKPIISWPIETAIASRCFDRVLVSTEDAEISAIARTAGADVPFVRPAELANDFATTVDVMAHATSWAQGQGWALSSISCIYPTAPLILADDLRHALQILESGDWSYVFSATTYAAPVFRAFCEELSGGVTMLFPDHASSRSQDLPAALHDAAQFYCGRPTSWLERVPVFTARSKALIIPRSRVQDIDDEDDWQRAEMIFQQLRKQAAGTDGN